jgi:hypothetical protein
MQNIDTPQIDWAKVLAKIDAVGLSLEKMPEDASEQEIIDYLVAEWGTMPPCGYSYPWLHPYSMGWRMGYGETYGLCLGSWWRQRFTTEEMIRYYQEWIPLPCWLGSVMEDIWDVKVYRYEDDDPLLKPYFEKLEVLGIGSEKMYWKDLEAPPKSKRWAEEHWRERFLSLHNIKIC